MKFTGKNLVRVFNALEHAKSDIRMHINSCPDVDEYADDIAELEIEHMMFSQLQTRVLKALKKEGIEIS